MIRSFRELDVWRKAHALALEIFHSKELIQFLNIAKRSVSEVQYLLQFSVDQELLVQEEFRQWDDRYEEVHRMLGGLRRSLNGFSRHSSLTTRH
ncbi:MAG: four helix bundle protein [Candidatus Omnitrophica bacterium]|nr:four helix bundle protein [Candidatus Omnitrophota bacterium]